jgi:hypothetical protein
VRQLFTEVAVIFTSADIATGAKAMQESRAWPAVFQAGSAAVLARACLEAVTKSKGGKMSRAIEELANRVKTDASLDILEAEAAALAKSRKVQTDGDRAMVNLMQRLIETLRYGVPKTPPISESSHHG